MCSRVENERARVNFGKDEGCIRWFSRCLGNWKGVYWGLDTLWQIYKKMVKNYLNNYCQDSQIYQWGLIGHDIVKLSYWAWFIETTLDALNGQTPSWRLRVMLTGCIKNHIGKIYALLPLFPCHLMSCHSIRESIIKVIYQLIECFQVVPYLPWDVLGSGSHPAGKVFEVVILYLAVKDFFGFPLLLSVDLWILSLMLLSFPNQVWLVLTKDRYLKHWICTFAGKRQCQLLRRCGYLFTNREGSQPSGMQILLCHFVEILLRFIQTYLPTFHCGVWLTPLLNCWFIDSWAALRHSVSLNWISSICFSKFAIVGMNYLEDGISPYVGWYLWFLLNTETQMELLLLYTRLDFGRRSSQ